MITELRRATTDEDLDALWRTMRDWRRTPPVVDRDAVVQVHLLGALGTEVFVGAAQSQRYIDAREVAERVTLLYIRRRAEAFRETPDAFVAVINARRAKLSPVKRVQKLKVVSGNPGALGVLVTLDSGLDYILSAAKDDIAITFSAEASEQKLTLIARLGVVRVRPGEPPRPILLNGAHLAFGDESVDRTDETDIR